MIPAMNINREDLVNGFDFFVSGLLIAPLYL